MRTLIYLCVLCLGLSFAPKADALNWVAERNVDDFTDEVTCRIQPGSDFMRQLLTGMTPGLWYFPIIERRSGQIRIGVTSDHGIPISGDLQFRVDRNPLVTVTAADTPLDSAPSIAMPELGPNVTPEVAESIRQSTQAAMAMASPYRVLTGERANDLIQQIMSGERTIWRVVGVNSQSTGTGEIEPNASLRRALETCEIDYEQAS